MKKRIIVVCLTWMVAAILPLSSCGNAEASPALQTVLEIELTENYDTTDPFIHEKLFCVSKDVDTLELDISLEMEGESGIIEILDRATGDVLWNSNTWTKTTNIHSFTVMLDSLEKEKDYVVRFTGTKIKNAKVVVSSANSLVTELERPRTTS